MPSFDRRSGDLTTLPGHSPEATLFLDERSRPDFRQLFVDLVRKSVDVSVAVTRVRLSTLDLEWDDLVDVESLRVLVVELNALTLDSEARLIQSDPTRAARVPLYRRLLESGRLEVRSAPLGGWSPDFSVFSDADGPSAVLVGRHWFERPYPHRGPAFPSAHLGEASRSAARPHRALWDTAHDVGPAVWSILSKAERARRAAVAVAG
ncbi:MAG: hypothetical protein HKO77_10105 [Gemmatimonadetes bacterium]|nr:hypothetical protein [Gemmatimonadota bacterium]